MGSLKHRTIGRKLLAKRLILPARRLPTLITRPLPKATGIKEALTCKNRPEESAKQHVFLAV
jgi:hypothetical protein